MKKATVFVWMCIFLFACQSSEHSEKETSDQWWTAADQAFILSELDRTNEELRLEIEPLDTEQWQFREDSSRWSIVEIVEHLEMQNQLHYREISVISQIPQLLDFRAITKGQDAHFSKYSTDTTRSQSRWFLEPKGKFCALEDAQQAFYKAREELHQFVKETDIDLRKQFTFRTAVEGKDINDIKIGQVRDLHQLLLTGIAHTDRHIVQIKNIKLHPDYPKKE